jgi:hypothetical protein
MFFKQGLLNADEEWSQHKKIIDTTNKGIRRSVPKNFPYFHVEFGLTGGGFAHIVEDEEKFPRNFGRDTVLGMLDMEPERLHRKRKSQFDEKEDVKKFLEVWKDYDWTQELDGGEYEPTAQTS